jgi:hypothetical protein
MAIKPRIDPHWARILERIQEDDCISIHKIYSSEMGFAYLTDKKGVRHKLEEWMDMDTVEGVIERVKRVNRR